jgi:hypothetical protein
MTTTAMKAPIRSAEDERALGGAEPHGVPGGENSYGPGAFGLGGGGPGAFVSGWWPAARLAASA